MMQDENGVLSSMTSSPKRNAAAQPYFDEGEDVKSIVNDTMFGGIMPSATPLGNDGGSVDEAKGKEELTGTGSTWFKTWQKENQAAELELEVESLKRQLGTPAPPEWGLLVSSLLLLYISEAEF